ncbi:MAG: DNA gyrase modulator, partial [Ignisphaera sp.]
MEPVVDVAEKVLGEALSRGAEEAIVRVQEKMYESVVFDNGVLRACSISRVIGLGLTVYVGDAVGYCYTSVFSKDVLSKVVEEAIASARAFGVKSAKEGKVEVKSVKGVYRT